MKPCLNQTFADVKAIPHRELLNLATDAGAKAFQHIQTATRESRRSFFSPKIPFILRSPFLKKKLKIMN
jgi:hypothetical protein